MLAPHDCKAWTGHDPSLTAIAERGWEFVHFLKTPSTCTDALRLFNNLALHSNDHAAVWNLVAFAMNPETMGILWQHADEFALRDAIDIGIHAGHSVIGHGFHREAVRTALRSLFDPTLSVRQHLVHLVKLCERDSEHTTALEIARDALGYGRLLSADEALALTPRDLGMLRQIADSNHALADGLAATFANQYGAESRFIRARWI